MCECYIYRSTTYIRMRESWGWRDWTLPPNMGNFFIGTDGTWDDHPTALHVHTSFDRMTTQSQRRITCTSKELMRLSHRCSQPMVKAESVSLFLSLTHPALTSFDVAGYYGRIPVHVYGCSCWRRHRTDGGTTRTAETH